MSRAVPTQGIHEGHVAGTTAVPNRETSPPVAVQHKDHHVGMKDKVKGQIKIAEGIWKHDPNLTQEGEILKEDGEHVKLGKAHQDAMK